MGEDREDGGVVESVLLSVKLRHVITDDKRLFRICGRHNLSIYVGLSSIVKSIRTTM